LHYLACRILDIYPCQGDDDGEAGELGYFLIKYIEKFNLDLSDGTGGNEPQIWFLPSGQKSISDYQASEPYLAKCRENTSRRLTKIEKSIDEDYKLC
jgi:hypothetical protein